MLTKWRQHGHDDDEEGDESVEDLDRQLQGAALLTPHAAASAATPCGEANTMVDVACACNKVYSYIVACPGQLVQIFWPFGHIDRLYPIPLCWKSFVLMFSIWNDHIFDLFGLKCASLGMLLKYSPRIQICLSEKWKKKVIFSTSLSHRMADGLNTFLHCHSNIDRCTMWQNNTNNNNNKKNTMPFCQLHGMLFIWQFYLSRWEILLFGCSGTFRNTAIQHSFHISQ